MRSLYAGLGPTLMGIVPYGGISFATFETIKGMYKRANEPEWEEDEMPVLHKLAAGAVAGLIAQTATYPLHVVRRRMQVYGPNTYPSVLAGLRTIYAREGFANGLFKGVGLTWWGSGTSGTTGTGMGTWTWTGTGTGYMEEKDDGHGDQCWVYVGFYTGGWWAVDMTWGGTSHVERFVAVEKKNN